ncbi:unnamed protein product, partial [Rotaria magnacalcarata]
MAPLAKTIALGGVAVLEKKAECCLIGSQHNA